MENLKPTQLTKALSYYSSYLGELITKTKRFCTLFQDTQKDSFKLEKKLGVYEKFQGFNRLSQNNLERLEHHFYLGIDLIKEELIKRRYEQKIKELQLKLGETPEPSEEKNDRNSTPNKKNIKELDEMCENLMKFLQKYETLENQKDVCSKNEDYSIPTVKKVGNFSIMDEIAKDINTSNENIQTKVSSFGEDFSQGNTQEKLHNNSQQIIENNQIFLIQDILNSQRLENEINEKTKKNMEINSKHKSEVEHSPDFSFQSQIITVKNFVNCKKDTNLSVDMVKKKKLMNKNKSISGIAFTESLEFSFHYDEDGKKIEKDEMENKMLDSLKIENIMLNSKGENRYLKKLTKEIAKK